MSIQVILRENKPRPDAVYDVESVRQQIGNGGEYEYEADSLSIRVMKEGAIILVDRGDENWIYIHPDQLEHLKTAIEIAEKTYRTALDK